MEIEIRLLVMPSRWRHLDDHSGSPGSTSGGESPSNRPEHTFHACSRLARGYALNPVDPPAPAPGLPAPTIKEASASPGLSPFKFDGSGPSGHLVAEIEHCGMSLPPSSVCQTPIYPTERDCVLKVLFTSTVRLPLFCGKLASPEFCVAPRGA